MYDYICFKILELSHCNRDGMNGKTKIYTLGPLRKIVNHSLREFQKSLLNRDSSLLNKSYGPDVVRIIFPPFHFLSREVFEISENSICPPNPPSMCLIKENTTLKMHFKHQELSPGCPLRVRRPHAE